MDGVNAPADSVVAAVFCVPPNWGFEMEDHDTLLPIDASGHDPPPPEALIQRLEDSFGLFVRADADLAGLFYEKLFAAAPDLRALFATDLTEQKLKFLRTLATVVENLRTPDVARARLRQLGRAHIGYGTQPEHYPIVNHAIVAAMAEVAGERWTAQLQADWTNVIEQVSAIMRDAAAGE